MLRRDSIDAKLALNVYKPDKTSHIKLDAKYCRNCKTKHCIRICPANLYSEKNGEIFVNFEGCLECGSCRVACKYIDWKNPKGGFGIQYRYG